MSSSDDAGLTGVLADGSTLAGAQAERFAGALPGCSWEESPPEFDGTMDEFAKARSDEPALVAQLYNLVKKCGCGKVAAALGPRAFRRPLQGVPGRMRLPRHQGRCSLPPSRRLQVCGYSLSVCNGCGSSLPEKTTTSANIFSGFIYGVARAPFPLTISIRQQTDDLVVFDDLLSLSPCHLNVVPTSVHIPDWRFLLKDPRKGLHIVTALEQAAWRSIREHFLADEGYRSKFLRGSKDGPWTRARVEAMRPHVIMGANFPPSQFQLHLQSFLMPFLPQQYQMYLDGQHMTKDRFFPVKYIKAVLSLGEPMPVTMDTRIEDIIAHFAALGVDYDAMHAACYASCGASHRALANWQPDDFALRIQGGQVLNSELDMSAVVAADKMVLQGYGRPYNQAGRPTGTYYKYRRTQVIPSWA